MKKFCRVKVQFVIKNVYITSIMTGYVVYNSQYQVIICKEHQYAISTKSLISHFRDKHDLDRATRQAINDYVSQFTITEAKNLTYSASRVNSIPYLNVIQGYQCEYNTCDIICGTLDTMKEHCKRQHLWKSQHGIRWSETRAQTFYQGNDRRYVHSCMSLTVDTLWCMS